MSEKEKIKILYKEVNKKPRIIEIKNTLEEKQRLVGGLIECVDYKDICIICNEEGKITGLDPNILFGNDYIAGNLIVAGVNNEEGEFISLTKEQIKSWNQELCMKSYDLEDSYEMECD